MSSPLLPFVARDYAKLKRHYPTEGRRKWRLRIAQQFWSAVQESGVGPEFVYRSSQDTPSGDTIPINEFDTDPDPLDGVTGDVPQLGLVVRTDFSDEQSWLAFRTCLRDSERELILGNDDDDDDESAPQQFLQSDSNEDEQDDDNDDEDLDAHSAIFYIINPSSPQERELLVNVSNLTVLRLFNDVDVRPSPTLPHGMSRINPPNRLADCHGWQEFYLGKSLWIYDTKSNTDQCVRVVSQSGDMYGTATGDSWRARASHIGELQVNLASGAIKINFGGLDRWDFSERKRNEMEAEVK